MCWKGALICVSGYKNTTEQGLRQQCKENGQWSETNQTDICQGIYIFLPVPFVSFSLLISLSLVL